MDVSEAWESSAGSLLDSSGSAEVLTPHLSQVEGEGLAAPASVWMSVAASSCTFGHTCLPFLPGVSEVDAASAGGVGQSWD